MANTAEQVVELVREKARLEKRLRQVIEEIGEAHTRPFSDKPKVSGKGGGEKVVKKKAKLSLSSLLLSAMPDYPSKQIRRAELDNFVHDAIRKGVWTTTSKDIPQNISQALSNLVKQGKIERMAGDDGTSFSGRVTDDNN